VAKGLPFGPLGAVARATCYLLHAFRILLILRARRPGCLVQGLAADHESVDRVPVADRWESAPGHRLGLGDWARALAWVAGGA
jgi:hypothetical protein